MQLLLVIVAMVVLFVGLLSIPICFRMQCSTKDPGKMGGMLHWAGGLLKLNYNHDGQIVTVTLAGFTLINKRLTGGKQKDPSPNKQKAKTKKAPVGRQFPSLPDWSLVTTGIAYTRRLLKSLALRGSVAGTYGYEEPHVTGIIAGILAAIRNKHLQIDLTPDFTGPVLDITGDLRGRVIPAHVLALGLSLLWQKPVRKIWMAKLKPYKGTQNKEAVHHV